MRMISTSRIIQLWKRLYRMFKLNKEENREDKKELAKVYITGNVPHFLPTVPLPCDRCKDVDPGRLRRVDFGGIDVEMCTIFDAYRLGAFAAEFRAFRK